MGDHRSGIGAARLIRRYQHSERARRARGTCRFDPSCSNYALEAFETRSFLVALAMTASRLLRCNPLVRRVSPDPVRRDRPLAPRPNTVRTLSALLLVGGSLVLVTASAAVSDEVTGGCTGTINGRDAESLTKSDPLVVEEGEVISVEGNIPTEFAGQNPNSFTTVKVEILADIVGVTTDEHSSTGPTYQSEEIDVDDYLQYGAGLYQVKVKNTGDGWECEYTGYVEMDTNPLTTPIGLFAVGSVAVGGVGVVAAKGTKRKPRKDWVDQLMDDHDRAERDDAVRNAREQSNEPEIAMVEEAVYHPFGPPCCFAALALPLAAMPVFGTGGGVGALPAGSTRVLWQRVLWKRGHVVWGFLAGGLLGLGVSLLLWQYAVWLLTIWTVFVLPVAVAIASAVYAWYGRRYLDRITVASSARASTAPPPAAWSEPEDADTDPNGNAPGDPDTPSPDGST